MPGGASNGLVSQVSSALVVCRDCGHAGVFFPQHFRRWGIPPEAPAQQMAPRFRCSPCRGRGDEGRRIVVEMFPNLEEASA